MPLRSSASRQRATACRARDNVGRGDAQGIAADRGLVVEVDQHVRARAGLGGEQVAQVAGQVVEEQLERPPLLLALEPFEPAGQPLLHARRPATVALDPERLLEPRQLGLVAFLERRDPATSPRRRPPWRRERPGPARRSRAGRAAPGGPTAPGRPRGRRGRAAARASRARHVRARCAARAATPRRSARVTHRLGPPGHEVEPPATRHDGVEQRPSSSASSTHTTEGGGSSRILRKAFWAASFMRSAATTRRTRRRPSVRVRVASGIQSSRTLSTRWKLPSGSRSVCTGDVPRAMRSHEAQPAAGVGADDIGAVERGRQGAGELALARRRAGRPAATRAPPRPRSGRRAATRPPPAAPAPRPRRSRRSARPQVVRECGARRRRPGSRRPARGQPREDRLADASWRVVDGRRASSTR